MRKVILVSVAMMLAAGPALASGLMKCDDAGFKRVKTASISAKSRKQPKILDLLSKAESAKTSGDLSKCSSLLEKAMGQIN